MFEYPIKIEKDTNGTYLVTFPNVPEAITFGDTLDEALMRAREALEVALSFYVDEGRPLPVPTAKGGNNLVTPSLMGSMKLAIYHSMKEQKIRKTDLARAMGVALMQVDRILDLTHASRLEQIEGALVALGKTFHVNVSARRVRSVGGVSRGRAIRSKAKSRRSVARAKA